METTTKMEVFNSFNSFFLLSNPFVLNKIQDKDLFAFLKKHFMKALKVMSHDFLNYVEGVWCMERKFLSIKFYLV